MIMKEKLISLLNEMDERLGELMDSYFDQDKQMMNML